MIYHTNITTILLILYHYNIIDIILLLLLDKLWIHLIRFQKSTTIRKYGITRGKELGFWKYLGQEFSKEITAKLTSARTQTLSFKSAQADQELISPARTRRRDPFLQGRDVIP